MRRITNIFFWLSIPLCLSGQLTPVINQYVLNPLTINPSYAGARGALNIAALYRKQWTGIAGSPETITLLIDAPVRDDKVGLGLIIINDKIGVTKETRFITNYAYKIDVGKGTLSFGLGAGLITTNTAWSDLVVLDQGDEFYLISPRRFVVPGFSFGTYYSNNNYFLGFSIPKFLSYKFNFEINKYSFNIDPGQYNYMLTAGFVRNLSSKLKFLPSSLLNYRPGEKILYDINAHFSYLDRFWAGGSYRNGRSVAGLLQVEVNNQIRVAYIYDFDNSKLRKYSNGSHEIMLRYEFRYRINVVNPLIF
ncbi:MAG: type IX secretion system membrane protein PorP/SprF [Bacteroidales bacterium]|nr:type IX secretion system membrane protein PorP/SprF [Bacteroidales bacterium]